MSVQFPPIKEVTAAHLGAFWNSQRSEFPNVYVAQPISSTAEDFDQQGQWIPPSLQVAFKNDPEIRVQMATPDDQWLIQVQSDRLVLNWRKKAAEYPRYVAVRERFTNAWSRWTRFLYEVNLDSSSPHQWELAYVNEVPAGTLWSTPDEFPEALPGLWGGRFGQVECMDLKGLRGQWVWDHRSKPARLYVESKPARKKLAHDKQDLLVVQLTARGRLGIPNQVAQGKAPWIVEIVDGFDLGHEMIVQQFDAIASKTAKQEWQRHE